MRPDDTLWLAHHVAVPAVAVPPAATPSFCITLANRSYHESASTSAIA